MDHKMDLFNEWRKINAASVPPQFIECLRLAWKAGMEHARHGSRATTNYEQYIASEAWKRFREKYRRSEYPQACLVCGDPDFHLHHITYKRLGRELLRDVAPLCRDCHHRVHELHKGSRTLDKFIRHVVILCGKRKGEVEDLMAPWLRVKEGRRKARKTVRENSRAASVSAAHRRP